MYIYAIYDIFTIKRIRMEIIQMNNKCVVEKYKDLYKLHYKP